MIGRSSLLNSPIKRSTRRRSYESQIRPHYKSQIRLSDEDVNEDTDEDVGEDMERITDLPAALGFPPPRTESVRNFGMLPRKYRYISSPNEYRSLMTNFPLLGLPHPSHLSAGQTTTPTPEQIEVKLRSSSYAKKIGPTQVRFTLDYIWYKMKTATLVIIRNGMLMSFLPLYNINYQNDFAQLLTFKEGSAQAYLSAKYPNVKKAAQYNPDPSRWNATNCLLRTEREDTRNLAVPTEAYYEAFEGLLRSVCAKYHVPDCVFIYNRKDFPMLGKNLTEAYDHVFGKGVRMKHPWNKEQYLPFLSQSTTDVHADIPVPTGDDIDLVPRTDPLPPWNTRKPLFFFRGRSTGCGNDKTSNVRIKLATLGLPENKAKYPVLQALDVGLMTITNRDKKNWYNPDVDRIRPNTLTPPIPLAKFVDRSEHYDYKFLINVEGNSAAYRMGSLFEMGACVIHIRTRYTLWFEYLLRNGVDYIVVNEDLSNLVPIIKWCLTHDRECEQIAKNGRRFYEKYLTRPAMEEYMFHVLSKLGKRLDPQFYRPDPAEINSVVTIYRSPDIHVFSIRVIPYTAQISLQQQFEGRVRLQSDEDPMVMRQHNFGGNPNSLIVRYDPRHPLGMIWNCAFLIFLKFMDHSTISTLTFNGEPILLNEFTEKNGVSPQATTIEDVRRSLSLRGYTNTFPASDSTADNGDNWNDSMNGYKETPLSFLFRSSSNPSVFLIT